MALSKIQSESVNLSDNFAFTGTVTGAGLTSPFANTVAVTSEGGAVTINLVQGLAKAFNAFDFNDNSTKDSLNIGSVTDRGTGSLYGNYTNNMNSVSHIAIGSVSSAAQGSMSTANNNRICIISSDTAARYSQNCTENNGTFNNVRYAAASIHGDLA
tara:strand:- start:314 stop:784 length:471 start_codon:yes stop_codon:yes gene_type:complete